MSRFSEIERQRQRDAEYVAAFRDLTPAQLEAMERAGIKGPDCGRAEAPVEHARIVVGRTDDAVALAESRGALSYTPDIAAQVGGLGDDLAERFGLEPAKADAVAKYFEERLRE